jgi:4-aminobutyrate aminotransferase/(S)-3-amino-2-methylpropionate transaminase
MEEKKIHLNTSVPGPVSTQLNELRMQNIPRGIASVVPFFISGGDGAVVRDVDGNTYIDFSSGIATVNVGHAHTAVVDAIREQAEKYLHTCFMVVPYESYVRLAERLNHLVPGDLPKKSMFFNSGAEAVENAVKVARRYTKKTGIISLECGFHGRTLLAMTLTSKVRPYKYGFGPFAPEIYKMASPYCYRCRFGLSYPECDLACASFLEKFFILESPAENIAALIVEPIQGEGGFIVPPPGYLAKLRELCSKHGILLIADEIQTGFSRTGKLFGVEHSGIVPDLMTVGKAIGGGLPLSGLVGRAEIMDVPDAGEVGGTFGGNPLACAAALKVLDVIEEEGLSAKAAAIGEKVLSRFRAMQEKYPLIGDVRGAGAMCALELVTSQKTKEPAAAQTKAVVQECYKNGLIALSAGIYSNVIRTLMPLVITDDQLEAGLDILEQAIAKANSTI